MPRSGKSPKNTSKRTPRKKATKTGPSGAKARKSATRAPAHKAQATPASGANSRPEAPARRRPHAAKTPFGKKDLHYFKNKLLERRRLILENVLTMEAEALKASGQDFSVDHMADHGSDNFEQDFTLSLVENERKELVDIDQALERIEHRSYGICEGSGEPIGRARLEAIPYARHSIDYQRRLESGELDETEDEFEDAERDRAGEKP